MALVVHKYGGTSVADPERIAKVAERVVARAAAGDQVAVVVSAMAGETGADSLDLSASTNASATLTGSDADGYAASAVTNVSGGFDGIQTLTGSAAGGTLTGDDVASTWTLDATPEYDESHSRVPLRTRDGRRICLSHSTSGDVDERQFHQ